MLDPGVPRSIENLDRLKNGRLAMRKDYAALAATTYSGGTLSAFDIVNFEGRLIALGDAAGRSVPTDIFCFLSGAAAAWVSSEGTDTDIRIPALAGLFREVGRLPVTDQEVECIDCAATGGF